MKKNYLIALLCILFFSPAIRAQTTEYFDAFPVNSTSFTNVSTSTPFVLTNKFTVSSLAPTLSGVNAATPASPTFGQGSANYVDNISSVATGQVNSIKTTGGKYMKAKEIYIYPSSTADGGEPTRDGGVIIQGKLGGTALFLTTITATTFTNTVYNGPYQGFTFVDLSAFSTYVIDELEFTLTGAYQYIALDNFRFTPASVPMTGTTSFTNVLCYGNATGAAGVSITGGSTPYTYTWIPSGGSGATASGLTAGDYTCTITDASSSVLTKVVSITQPASAVGGVISIQTELCNGGNTGSATVTASGGTFPYTYVWNNGSTSTVISTQTAGVKTVTITDNNGCTSVRQNTITQPGAISTATGYTNVYCNGGANGSATVIVGAGGVAPYTYSWSTGATGTVVTNLTAGTYTVRATDANGCSTGNATRTVVISQPSALVSTTAVTNALCNGANGSATVTASGGVGAYSYTWSSGPTFSVEPTLLAGTYTVRVTDANSCSITKSVTVTQPLSLVTTTAVTNAVCNGASGSATLTASGGTVPYTYLWSTGATTSVVTLPAGAYTATITDANSCTSVKGVSITQPASGLTTSTVVTNALCNGANGSATVSASGGTGVYTYSWSSGATTSVVATPAGAYTATVTDVSGCIGIVSANITQPSALSTSTAVTNALCNGNNGTATLTVSGGTGAYTYSWSTAATTSVVTLPAGAYTATVTDGNSCTSVKGVTISQPSALSTSTAVANVLCNGGNGTATITPSGGTSAYTYSWSTGATTSVVAVPAGAYTATVTDVNNCTSVKGVTVNQPSALVTTTAVANALCNGANGTATITASGGTGAYTYSWSSGATTSVVAVPAGAYTATVTDVNGCTSIKSVNITQPASALSTSTAVTNVLCNGNNGTATLTASGGTGAYTYSWSSGATASVVTVPAGAYTATVTDANSCSIAKSVNITQPSALVTTTAVTNVLCNGGNGTATLTVSGGTGAYTYSWSTGATASVVAVPAGAYTATVTDANSCSIAKSVNITQPSSLSTSTAIANALCNGGNGTATLTASGGTGAYTYSWSSGATASVVAVPAGAYTATVTDANNCSSTNSVTISAPGALVTTTTVINVLCHGASTGAATVTPSGGTSPYNYLWSNAANTSTVSGLMAGVYTSTITDANSCTSVNTLTITESAPLLVTASTTNSVICSGQSTTLNGGGADTYTWTSSVINGVAFNPTVTTTYSVTGTNTVTGCVSNNTAVQTITVNTTPTLSVNSGVICSGNSFTMVPAGANTYTYSSGSDVVSPMTSTSYSVTGTSLEGCISNNTAISSVTVNITPTVTVNSGAICTGQTFTMVPGGADTYTYSSVTATVNPLTDQTYSVTGTSLEGCVSANTAIASVTVNGTPTVTVNSGVICTGQTFTMIPGGADTYTYSSVTATVNPLTNQTYSVTGTSLEGCIATNTAIASVTVNITPTVTVNSGVICTGQTFTMVPGGADTYTYSSGTSTVNPLTDQAYSVTGTSIEGCIATNTAIASVTVNITPTVTVNSGVICTGQTFTMVPGGADTYTYSSGTSTVNPLTDQTYSVTGTSLEGCIATNTAIASVTVNVTPTVTVNSGVICTGQTFTMIPGGANTYTYSSSTDVVSPMTNTSYSVTGTSIEGCLSANTAVSSVTVNITPTITVNSGSICTGQTFTMIPGGADSYTYSSGTSTVNPLSNDTYSVTGTSLEGCVSTNTAIASVTVNITPTVTVNSGVICTGQTFTMIPGGADTYTYSSGTSTVNPLTSATYSVTGTSLEGCVATNTAIASVTVNITPTVTVNSGVICTGQTFTMIPGGADTYTYSSGTSTVNPLTNQSYTVTGTSIEGCVNTNTAIASVTVNVTPTVTVNSGTICTGQTFTMIPAGADTYTYSSGTSTVNPLTNNTYSVTGTSLEGCVATNTAIASVTVNITPTVTVNSGVICSGNSFTMVPAGADTYTYSSGTDVVSPVTNTSYTVSGTSIEGCVNTNTAVSTITVNITPTITVNSGAICVGQSFTMTPAGANTYTYSNGSNVVSPSSSATYSVSGTASNGCVSMTSAVSQVTVNSLPNTVIVPSSTAICDGSTAVLTAGGATSYTWNTGSTTSSISVNPTSTTSYTVTGSNGAGCDFTATLSLVVNTNPTVDLGPDVEIKVEDTYQFNPTQTGAVSYSWSPGTDLSNPSIINPTTSTQSDITYALTVTSVNGCIASDDINVKVLTDLVIADYMSPNGDGINDTWKISIPALVKTYSVEIIDSWGKTVFSKPSDYNNEWGADNLPAGVYYYVMKDGNTLKHKGSITVTK